jgi:aminoglycoside phosphotransferase (APT) family kinase protein
MTSDSVSRLSQGALDWIHSRTGQRVTGTTQLFGGLTSDVDAVTLADGASLVLRRYIDWGDGAGECIEREAAMLTKLAGTSILAPRLVAAEPSGDVPMLLMTRIPGEVWLTPRDFESWLGQIARTRSQIHAVPLDDVSPGRMTAGPLKVGVPRWTTRRELWKRAGAIVARAPDAFAPVLIHSDYQHFNMLWSAERMTGVVDWTYAGPGHPDRDVAHCRLNLAVLFSTEVAERFRALYETESGRRVDPLWDLRGMVCYDDGWSKFIPIQVAGRTKVDAAGMDARIEGLMERILERM